jgi:hypothetical protein
MTLHGEGLAVRRYRWCAATVDLPPWRRFSFDAFRQRLVAFSYLCEGGCQTHSFPGFGQGAVTLCQGKIPGAPLTIDP